jgi:uncharacterized membrane protein
MNGRPPLLNRVIEAVLTAGVLASGGLMLAGLALERTPLLQWGIVVLMLTPVARVVVVTIGLTLERDWAFALISLWILAVLASSMYVAAHVERPGSPTVAPARRA